MIYPHVLALDLSTKPGYAFYDGEALKFYSTVFPEKSVKDFGEYPFSFLGYAEYVTNRLMNFVSLTHKRFSYAPMMVVIEETTAGRNNYSQKILEFIHYQVLRSLEEMNLPVVYIRTGVWRKIVGANLNASEKALNVKIRAIKRKTKSKVAKIDGKVVGKRTKKHAALRAFKEHFGIELPNKMEDACEAALVGLAYRKGAPICDGTINGGTFAKAVGI